MILNISEDINSGSLNKLIDALNKLKDKEKLYLYLNTEGGEVDSMEAIIDIINQNCDIVELIGYGGLYSAGFVIFFSVECRKVLLPQTIGMFHLTFVKLETNGVSTKGIDRAMKNSLKEESERTLKFCNDLGMTKKEISNIMKGEDIFFQYSRMIEFLNNSSIGKSNKFI